MKKTRKTNKSVDASVYDENYYLSVCLGSEEYLKSGGKVIHPKLERLLQSIPVDNSYRILDLGCGRGDITVYFGKKVKEAVGIDYSKHAIRIAESTKKNFPPQIQNHVHFHLMNIKQLQFSDDYFDVVIGIDVLEHLYKEEVELAMNEIKRVLKNDGLLFIHTGANKTLYDFTYKYYTLPMNKMLVRIDQIYKGIVYQGLPDDPRSPAEKVQHVNEPTYSYLIDLFKKYHFHGKIQTEIGFIKEKKGLKAAIYNFLIAFYPLSQVYPLSMLFGSAFVCRMRNIKL